MESMLESKPLGFWRTWDGHLLRPVHGIIAPTNINKHEQALDPLTSALSPEISGIRWTYFFKMMLVRSLRYGNRVT